MTVQVEIDPRNAERDAAIMEAARQVIRKHGLGRMTRALLSEYAGLSATSVCNFGRTSISTKEHDRTGYRERLLKALMAQAVADRDVVLIGAGLADGALKADEIPDDLRAMMGV